MDFTNLSIYYAVDPVRSLTARPMSTGSFSYEREIAVEAVRQAARLCVAVQQQLAAAAIEKEDRTPVTIADFGSQALIARMLRSAFPTDAIMAEEDAATLRDPANEALAKQLNSFVRQIHPGATIDQVCNWIDYGNLAEYRDRFWTIDPIDGTKGFLRGDQYAVALALLVDGKPRVAALACPNLPHVWENDADRGWIFVAEEGEGAIRQPIDPSIERPQQTPIGVSTTRAPEEARFCESVVSEHSSHDTAQKVADMLGITEEPLRVDSQCKYAIVARGEAEIYMRLPRPGTTYVERIWDHAAGALIMTEAGGQVTDLDGRALDFTQGMRLEQNRGILATNAHLHDDLLQALRRARA